MNLHRYSATERRQYNHHKLQQLVALSVVRELGPVVTALLFAGRAGSALAAEIGYSASLMVAFWVI